MSEKNIYLAFQVLNFIFGDDSLPYQLSADEEKMLLALARHFGAKGIYPSTTTLAKETKRSQRAVITTLFKLEEKLLLNIKRESGKSSHYIILLPELSTTTEVHFTSQENHTTEAHFSAPLKSTTLTTEVHFSRYNKRTNKKNKLERERQKRAHPLPDDFMATKADCDVAKECGFGFEDFEEEILKFIDHYKSTGDLRVDWSSALRKWIRSAHPPRSTKQEVAEEVRSTVPWSPAGDPLQRRGMGEILKNVLEQACPKTNGIGGHRNGLGDAEKGKR